MTTFPYVDRHGHTYADAQEVTEAVTYLENDAAYLRAQVDKYRDPAVRQRVAENAEKSASYAAELRQALATQRLPAFTPTAHGVNYENLFDGPRNA